MGFVIVTGMSGAGKTVALKILEDIGYYCVDNIPISLIDKFAELTLGKAEKLPRVALGIDIRSGDELPFLQDILNRWDKKHFKYEILFIEASDKVLIKRFKETRRNHPLTGEARIHTGIEEERFQLGFLKARADCIIDTSQLLTRELKQKMEEIYLNQKVYNNLYVTILSFGFKYGIPQDADLVFDVRFLPNPYYVEGLRLKTGNTREVQEYVTKGKTAEEFLNKLEDMLAFLIPNYILEGKNQLVIGIGCTGGRHRSVTIANALYKHLISFEDYGVKVEHRDIDKDNKQGKKE